jgi:hypothetical protein
MHCRLTATPPPDDVEQHNDNSNYQKDMNESSHGVEGVK